MIIRIYDREGGLKAEVSPTDGSTAMKEIGSDNVMSLSFTHYEYIELDVDDYTDFEGERYWLCERYRPRQKSTLEWEYNVKLYGMESLLRNILVIKRVDGEDEPVFTLTAPPREHVAMIVNCLNEGLGNISDWKVGQVDGAENITVDYFGKYCDEALREIAEKVGAEYWADGETVNVCRCEHGEAITLGYDKGLTGIEPDRADNVKFYTRLYPVGSSRNIDREKYGHTRLQLPGGRKYVEVNADKYGRVDHYEEAAFADIYPRRIGKVSSVRSEVKTGEDGNPFTIYYFRDDSLPFDPNKYEIPGLVKRVSFQEGSELAGLGSEDDGTYYFEVNFNSTTREFEIITIWPYDDDRQLPGEGLVPKAGDRYILWNLRMPDEYYGLAEAEFAEAVERYNEEHWVDVTLFKATTDHVWIEDNYADLFVGRRVRLESDVYFPESGYRDSRITKVTRRLNLPSLMDIEIGDAVGRSSKQKFTDDIADVRSFARSMGASASLPDIIRTGDRTRPTDNNLFSAKRSRHEFLSRLNDDTAAGVIEFLRGLVADEIARLRGGAEFGDFESGMATGRGGAIDDAGNGELESLRVRSYLEVLELIINRLQAIEGDTVLTESDQITEVTDLGGGNYRLKLKEKWDGYFTAMTVDTVLRGIYNTMSRGGGDYYTSWMLVTAVDTAANELTVMLYGDDEVPGEKNFAPIAMMNVARWGHRTDERRQRCLYLSSTEGRIVNLVGVRQPLLTAANYGSTLGRVPEFISRAFGFAEGQEGVYTKYLFVENLFHVDHLGVPLPTVRDRGLWTAGGDYYDGSTLREATGDYEISDVWHNGLRWRCCKLATTAEPSDKTTDWAYIEGLTLVSTKTEYALSISGTVTPEESAWSETQPEPKPLMWLWTRTTLTFSDGSVSVSYTKSYIAKDGASYSDNLLTGSAKGWSNSDYPTATLYFGDDKPAAGEKFTATLWGAQLGEGKTHFAMYNSGGWVRVGNFEDKGGGVYMLQGVWEEDDGNGHSVTTELVNIYAMPASVTDVTSEIGKVKIERGWNDSPVWTPNAADTEAVAVSLSSESHVFEGDTDKAVAATARIDVTAYKGERQITTAAGTITGVPAGMTVMTGHNGTTETRITVAVTAALTQRQGVLTIPVTADGKTFIKQFSWSLSLKGDKGDDGADGAKGDRGPALRGPQRWADLADGFGFESGGEGETFLDVVMTESLKPGSTTERQVNYFVCIQSHAKSASIRPDAAGSQYWKPMSTIEFVATKILLAQYALVKNLGVESLEMKDADGNIIAWIRDGNVLFNKGTFSNVKVVAGGTTDQRIELDPETKSIRIYDDAGNECLTIDGTRQEREAIEGYKLELTAPGSALTPWTLPIDKTTTTAGLTLTPTLLTMTPAEDSYITVNVPKLTLAVKRETPGSPTAITGDTSVKVTLQVAQGTEVANEEIGSYLLENGTTDMSEHVLEVESIRKSFKVKAGVAMTLKLFVFARFASGSVKLTNPTATYVFDRYQSKIFANGMTLMRTNRDYLTIYADKNGRIYLDRGSTVGSCHRFNGVTQPATLYAARVWADIETTKPTVYAGKATVRKGTTAGQWKLTMPVDSLVHTGNTLAWPVSNKAGWTVAEVSRTMVDNALEFTFVTADPSGTAAWGAAWTVEVKLY